MDQSGAQGGKRLGRPTSTASDVSTGHILRADLWLWSAARVLEELKKLGSIAMYTSGGTGFTPGGEPPLVLVPHPGVSIRD